MSKGKSLTLRELLAEHNLEEIVLDEAMVIKFEISHKPVSRAFTFTVERFRHPDDK